MSFFFFLSSDIGVASSLNNSSSSSNGGTQAGSVPAEMWFRTDIYIFLVTVYVAYSAH